MAFDPTPYQTTAGQKVTRSLWNGSLTALAAAIGSGGGGSGLIDAVADRTALAAVNPASKTVVFLRENGREGLFEWDSTDRSADVTLDTRQGIYVAPASATSGASGAWVRRFDGPVMVDWFGAVGDDATNDGPAFVAALDFLDRNRVDYQGAQTLRCGAKNYYLGTSQLNIRTTLVFEGAGVFATRLRWAANTKGIVVQRLNTADGTTVGGEYGGAGDYATIRLMQIKGGFTTQAATPEGEYHGVELRAAATLEDLLIRDWQGDGIFSRTNAGSGGANEGQASTAQIFRVRVRFCRNNVYIDGPDSNIWNVVGLNTTEARRYNLWDTSFLGNTYSAMHNASGGHDAVFVDADVPRTKCTYSGKLYQVAPDQGAGAQANPPTGAATSNTYWIYNGTGGYAEAWSNTQVYRDGGSVRTDDPNAVNCFTGCYLEGGQNAANLAARDIIVGGLWSACGAITNAGGDPGAIYGGWLEGSTIGLRSHGKMQVDKDFLALSKNNFIGPDGVYDGFATTLQLRTTGTIGVDFYVNSYGSAGYIGGEYFSGLIVNSYVGAASEGTRFRVNDAEIMRLKAAGLSLASGKVLQVNGTQVVGAQGAAVADAASANATDLATAITLVNELKTTVNTLLGRLRAATGHGLIA